MCSAGRAKVWKRSARLQRHSVRCVRACVHHVTDHEAAGGGEGGRCTPSLVRGTQIGPAPRDGWMPAVRHSGGGGAGLGWHGAG
jgi:hypothetical protein